MVRVERKFLLLRKIMTEIQAKLYDNTEIINSFYLVANLSDTKTYSLHSKNVTLIEKK